MNDIVLTTFSIVARDPKTGMLGISMASAAPRCGSIGPHAAAGAGAIATQGQARPEVARQALKLLQQGDSADEVLQLLVRHDGERDARQWGIVDSRGKAAAFTGDACEGWAGHIIGDGFTVQGNFLAGKPVIEAMAATASRMVADDLANRLLSSLERGQQAGGDQRGKRSASLLVYGQGDEPLHDIRVDDHSEPIAELRRLFNRETAPDQHRTGGVQKVAEALLRQQKFVTHPDHEATSRRGYRHLIGQAG